MKNSFKPLPPFKGWVLQNFPFIEEDFDAITSYQLWCKVVDYLNNTNNNVNVLAKEVLDIKNYFDNLDLQEEVNTKLDEMAESGELTDIIAQYLQLAGILAFNTLDDLKNANNVVNGSLVETYGRNTYNDGLGEKYKIRNIVNTDVIDNINIIALTNFNNLVAERIIEKDLTEMVVFGDSWSDERVTDTIYPSIVANNLNLHLNNFAVNGAGFVNPASGELISTQVNEFLNSNIDKKKVKYIIMLGGINEYRNNGSITDLYNEVNRLINILHENCQQAKILFVSNCEYPYSLAQSNYWQQLHRFIKAGNNIATLNLDGTLGIDIFNSSNYFHLTQAGQKYLASQIICALTGGELLPYKDVRNYSDEDIDFTLISERVGNIFVVAGTFHCNNSISNKTITIPGVNINYSQDIQVFGFSGRSYQKGVIAINNNTVVIAIDGGSASNADYYFNIMIPIIN